MMISTRGRYALRVMADLASTGGENFVPLKEIAERQEISLKYLESIVTDLVKAGLLEGRHGKGGGYRLLRAPEDYTVGEVLRTIEGDLAPVACLGKNAAPCARASICPTIKMWAGLYDVVSKYFDGITVRDLTNLPDVPDYVI